ncbi:MAG TPA: flagellar M-ring protein FliF [Firmicutes bacterium]|nr:flagellar M-ring protein FliF [Candidatus Fermentithermobacillaceae bacterium]
MGTSVAQLTKGIRDTWSKLGKTPRLVIIASVATVFVVCVVALAISTRGQRYEILWSNLDLQDAGAIVSELERQGIPYELADGGRTVKIPGEEVHRTRLSLASQGLPSSGIVGFESIQGNSIWATDFERRVQYTRALSGELVRTVKSISGVRDARVHIVIPENTVFATLKTPATAAVLLDLVPGKELGEPTVRGIMNLVARSVEGLSPDDVTVMDTSGRLLSQDLRSDSLGSQVSATAFEMTSRVERELESRLLATLTPVLGPGNVVCQVRATLNLDQVRIVDDQYASDPQGVLRSTQQVTESYQGTGTPVGGVAGGLDVPTYATAGQGESQYQRTETITNYEVSRTTTETIVTPGSIKNLSVAVMVNRELDDDEKSLITEGVTAALGLDPLRQDKISVIGMPFDTSLVDVVRGGMTPPEETFPRVYIYAIAVAAALILGTIILLLMRRRRAQAVEPLPEPLPLVEEAPTLSPDLLSRQKIREDIERMARVNPAGMAALLKTWLLEDEY